MKSGGIVNWVLRLVVPGLMRAGNAINKIFSAVSPHLPTLSMSRLAGFVRADEQAAQTSERIGTRPVSQLFARSDVLESDMMLTRRYMVKYQFTVRDKLTGEEWQEYRNMYYNKLDSYQNWIDSGVSRFGRLFDPYKVEIIDSRIHNVYHKAGWSY